MKLEGKAKLVRIHFGEDDQFQGKPLHEAIIHKCQELDMAGATVYRGFEGYGASTRIHRSHGFHFSSDAPIVVTIVDSDEKVRQLIPHLDAMLNEGLIAVSDVEVIRYKKQD
jgi:PII-like signaling protein